MVYFCLLFKKDLKRLCIYCIPTYEKQMKKEQLYYLINQRAVLVTETCYISGKIVAVDDSCTQLINAQIIDKPAFHDVFKEPSRKEITWLIVNNMKIWDAYAETNSLNYKYSVNSENITPKATDDYII